MLPANSPPTNGKTSQKRKAPAAPDSPAQLAAGQPTGKAEPSVPADVEAGERPPAKKLAAAKRPGVARTAPVKRAKASEGGQPPVQALQPPEKASQAAIDGLPDSGAALTVLLATDAGPANANAEDDAPAPPDGHGPDAARPDAAPAATGPGEGVALPAAALPPCKKKGGWPKGKPRRNHVATGKVRFWLG